MSRRLVLAAVALAVASTVATAQTRGMGRISGKITDEQGQPIEGVTVKATIATGREPVEVKTNRKGEWAIGGIAPGAWNVDFTKEGYEPRSISVSVAELTRLPPIEIQMTKAASTVDPNVEIRAELEKAAALLNDKKYAEARATYEALIAKYPQVPQFYPMVARTYHAEKQYDKAIESLRLALAKEANNVEVKILLGSILIEKGDAEEGRKVLDSINPAQLKDPLVLVNAGILLINQNKPSEALIYFDQAIAGFPNQPDAYYYRAITRLQLGKNDEAKADLQKFLELAPGAPEADTARKILAQLK